MVMAKAKRQKNFQLNEHVLSALDDLRSKMNLGREAAPIVEAALLRFFALSIEEQTTDVKSVLTGPLDQGMKRRIEEARQAGRQKSTRASPADASKRAAG